MTINQNSARLLLLIFFVSLLNLGGSSMVSAIELDKGYASCFVSENGQTVANQLNGIGGATNTVDTVWSFTIHVPPSNYYPTPTQTADVLVTKLNGVSGKWGTTPGTSTTHKNTTDEHATTISETVTFPKGSTSASMYYKFTYSEPGGKVHTAAATCAVDLADPPVKATKVTLKGNSVYTESVAVQPKTQIQATQAGNSTPSTSDPGTSTPVTPDNSTPTDTSTPGNDSSTSSGSSTSSNSDSSSSNNSSSDTTATTTTTTTSTENTSTTPPDPLPSPDIVTCKIRTNTLYFEGDQPAFDIIGNDCVLSQQASVKASIYDSTYDVKSADNSGSLMKTLQLSRLQTKGKFFFTWNGYDDYDQPGKLGDYNFVVESTLNSSFKPDISIQKFKIANAPGTETAEEKAANPTANTDGTATVNSGTTEDTLHGAAASVSDTANGVLQTVANALSGTDTAPVNQPKTASKCPGTFYPTDITGSPFETAIKTAYDLCLVRGYDDGTFRPQQGLTRAEATKIMILASGHVAKQGCYDNDCGSPFIDLDTWQGPWVRAAWELKFVSGVGAGQFAPNRKITRAEAVALIVKSFKMPPHIGCYSANCGAGYPNNFFNDIKLGWEGQYLRPLWDAHVISADPNGNFYPDIPVSRGEIIDWILKLNKGVAANSDTSATVVPTGTATGASTTATSTPAA